MFGSAGLLSVRLWAKISEFKIPPQHALLLHAFAVRRKAHLAEPLYQVSPVRIATEDPCPHHHLDFAQKIQVLGLTIRAHIHSQDLHQSYETSQSVSPQ